MDILDLIKGKDGYFFNAQYRQYNDSAPQFLTYKEISNPTERFSTIISNMVNIAGAMTIATLIDCGYKINGLITTQDGKLWQIQDIQEDCKNSRAVRFLTDSPLREYTIGLILIDNPQGLK